MDYNKELDLLSEYMDIYIQLLSYCVWIGTGLRIRHKNELPTFEYFKETYHKPSYSMVIPHYKEQVDISNNELAHIHTHGLGGEDSYKGIAYRYYNDWRGCKYYVNGNLNGNYEVNVPKVKAVVKRFNK